jgi:hypothetical protein
MTGRSLLGQYNASPCPTGSGLASLLFKLYFVFYFIYQLENSIFGEGHLGTNYWIVENTGNIKDHVSKNLLSEFHMDDDIKLRIGNS